MTNEELTVLHGHLSFRFDEQLATSPNDTVLGLLTANDGTINIFIENHNLKLSFFSLSTGKKDMLISLEYFPTTPGTHFFHLNWNFETNTFSARVDENPVIINFSPTETTTTTSSN